MVITTTKSETYKQIIFSNSPWIESIDRLKEPEKFRRECFFSVKKQLEAKHNMAILIKGPRRVGKTEIQKQLIWDLIKNEKIDPKKILYLSFDDVQIQSEKPEVRVKIIQEILDYWANLIGFETYDKIENTAFCFFDEVQSVKEWDFLIKNRIERTPNVKMVLSGSAAHTIFQKSLKTLMGRLIPVDISTFSFREFLSKENFIDDKLNKELRTIQEIFESTLSPKNVHEALSKLLKENENAILFRKFISLFLQKGGFPQIWKINNEGAFILEQAHFIDENYVKKVTLEDLMLLQQIKKPEIYERLLRHLFARPGQEYNQNSVARELGATEVTLGEAIRLIHQTDLLIFVEKFSNKAEPLRRQNIKVYPIDYGLTFAMTKILPNIEIDTQKGPIAEALVAQTLKRLRGVSHIAYLQNNLAGLRREIDFYLRSDLKDCPIEVKYKNTIDMREFSLMEKTILEKQLEGGLVINIDSWEKKGSLYFIPLWAFMLIS